MNSAPVTETPDPFEASTLAAAAKPGDARPQQPGAEPPQPESMTTGNPHGEADGPMDLPVPDDIPLSFDISKHPK